jgi:heme/copper-type cytochrome/quinol oxidase subunit 2
MPPALSEAIFWVAVACCAVAELFILRSVFAVRGAGAADGALPRVRRPVEVLWAVVPAVALALVLAATWRTLHPGSSEPLDTPTGAPPVDRDVRAGALT